MKRQICTRKGNTYEILTEIDMLGDSAYEKIEIIGIEGLGVAGIS